MSEDNSVSRLHILDCQKEVARMLREVRDDMSIIDAEVQELKTVAKQNAEILRSQVAFQREHTAIIDGLRVSLNHLADSISDFKVMFTQAIPLRLVVILMIMMSGMFLGAEVVKKILGLV